MYILKVSRTGYCYDDCCRGGYFYGKSRRKNSQLDIFMARRKYSLGLSFRNRDRRRTKTGTNHNPDPNRYRRCCPDPNARIQKTEELQIKTENTKIEIAEI